MLRRVVLLSCVAIALSPAPASACGGLFCDRGPSMPDAFGNPPPTQSGEEIVYGIESDGSLVMSVRIFYQGAAPEFAWILPVPTTPAVSLGADALFSALGPPTQPYFLIERYETLGECLPDPECVWPPPRGGVSDASISISDTGAARGDAGSSGPTVELMTTLGPYETVVLSGGTGAEVQMWLADHGYVIPVETTPLLDDYASHGSHFVALRLRGDASIDQIQPITLTMPATSPCLPIRLTALATQPDLPITGYFLADARVVSANYSMLDPDYADLGLYQGSTSYFSYITRAADTAGGKAFATDYAGATPTVALELPSVIDLGTETDPATFLRALQSRGYLSDSQLLAVLQDYLVPPAGMAARAYYNCLVFGFGACPAPMSFDPMGAVTAIDQTITQPRHDAQALVGRHPYTTRLFTTLSAPEMTLDPEFRVDAALPEVPAMRGATQTTVCDSQHYAIEAGGFYTTARGVRFGDYAARPHVSPDVFCSTRGMVWVHSPGIDGGRYPDGGIAEARVPSGGAGCAAGRRGAGGWCLAIGVILAAWLRLRSGRSRSSCSR